MGQIYARESRALGCVDIRGACDTNLENLRRFVETFDVPVSGLEFREVLRSGEFDFAYIATPHAAHVEPAVEAAGLGVAVLLEKPMATDLAGARRIEAAVRKHGVRFALGVQQRFTRRMVAFREALSEWDVGRVVFLRLRSSIYVHSQARLAERRKGTVGEWLFDREVSGGGVLMTEIPHWGDVMAWLGGGRASSVFCRSATYSPSTPPGIEDAGQLLIEFENGLRGLMDISWAHLHPVAFELSALGEERGLHLLGDELVLTENMTVAARRSVPEEDRSPYGALLERFVSALLGREADPQPPGLDEAVWTQEMVEAAYLSAASGRVVRLPDDLDLAHGCPRNFENRIQYGEKD